MTQELITQAEFARRMDVARSRVTALKHEGRLVIEGDLVVWPDSRDRVLATRNATHDDQAKALIAVPPVTEGNPRGTPTVPVEQDAEAPLRRIDAQARKEHLAAELLQLDLDERVGKLRRAEDVLAAQANIYTTVRTRLEAIPFIVGPQLAAISNEQQCIAILTDQIGVTLSDLVAEFSEKEKQ